MEFLRTIQHLRPRTNLFSATFRVRSVAAYAIHKFFQERGFVYIHTPIITASDCEGAGEMFRVTTLDLENVPRNEDGTVDYTQDFFGKSANLTVSGQLQAENFAMAFGDVYTFGPTFRAENSNTQRHAAEFWMIEPEIAFADLKDDMDLAEDMIKYIITLCHGALPRRDGLLQLLCGQGPEGAAAARRHLRLRPGELHRGHRDPREVRSQVRLPRVLGLRPADRARALSSPSSIFKKPVFVTDYPKEIKAFYMRLNDDGKTVAAADCLVPGIGEIIGGSQREERLDRAGGAAFRSWAWIPTTYKYYCDLRRYGGCRHAGFGLGFERMVMYLTGVSNIRDVLPHPRTVGNADF